MHDSGAERSLVADLAHSLDVPFAPLSAATRAALAGRLDDGLEAGNPLDVWGGGSDTRALFGDCLATIAADPAVGVTALAVDLVPEYDGDISYPDAVEDVVTATDAPVVVLTGLPGAVDDAAAERLRLLGVPVLEGFRPGLLALRHLLDSAARPAPDELDLAVDEQRQARWRHRLRVDRPLAAAELGDLLADYGIPHARGARRVVPSGGDRRRGGGRLADRPQDRRARHRAPIRRRRRRRRDRRRARRGGGVRRPGGAARPRRDRRTSRCRPASRSPSAWCATTRWARWSWSPPGACWSSCSATAWSACRR